MKKLLLLIAVALFVASCATTRNSGKDHMGKRTYPDYKIQKYGGNK